MRIEDFGFEPEIGKQYSITFTEDGELLKHVVYDGSDLGALSFKDGSTVTLAITDYETGKLMFNTDFVAYNGKLYKKVFKLPLKNEDTNMNSNVHIENLHYDLTTGSVLVQVQGFTGENYKLVVSGSTTDLQTLAMPIVLEDNMHYSISTELIQGDEFNVTLFDEYDTTLDVKTFVAPISTDWRFNEQGELNLDYDQEETLDPLTPTEGEVPPVEEVSGDGLGTPIEGDMSQQVTTEDGALMLQEEEAGFTDSIFFKAGIGILLLVVIAFIIMKIKKGRAARANARNQNNGITDLDDDEDDENDEEEDDVFNQQTSRTTQRAQSNPRNHLDADDDDEDDDDEDDLLEVSASSSSRS